MRPVSVLNPDREYAQLVGGAEQLQAVYEEAYEWASKHDPDLVCRQVVPAALESEVAVVGQALAENTQRLSGLPYTLPGGTLSGGGRELEKFLAGFRHTIDPAGSGQYVYSTDLVHHYPGKKPSGNGDRVPTEQEIAHCAKWLEAELAIEQPRVLVLLGKLPSLSFLERYAGVQADTLKQVVGQSYECSVNGHAITAFPVYHPSGAFQHPSAAAVYEQASSAIQELL